MEVSIRGFPNLQHCLLSVLCCLRTTRYDLLGNLQGSSPYKKVVYLNSLTVVDQGPPLLNLSLEGRHVGKSCVVVVVVIDEILKKVTWSFLWNI